MGVNFENDTLFTMHDLVHDLARSIMVDEILVSSNEGNSGGSCCHFALLNDCCKPLESSKIRALRFMECGETELHGAAFSSSKSMRVLDLRECSIHKLPDSIGVLKQLRYLNTPRVQDTIIPNSITRLSKLIYLNLHGSKILALPESIGEIQGLAYLDLSGCSGIKKLPESFGRLTELVHLDFSNCSLVRGISESLASLTQLKYLNLSYCPNIGKLPEALGGLCKLQYLNLSFSSYLECYQAEVLGALTRLEYLNLSSVQCTLLKLPEALGRFSQLKYLNLSGCVGMIELPRFGGLKLLAHLDLSHCYNVHQLHESFSGLTSLQYLNLKSTRLQSLPGNLMKLRYLNISSLRYPSDTFDSIINHISSNFFDLEHLDLSNNSVRRIPESLCSLRKLHTLDLSHCTTLQNIAKGVGKMDSLKFLDLNGCIGIRDVPQLSSSSISLPHFVVQADGDSSSNLVHLQDIDSVELQISNLQNVKSTAEADGIKLMEKQSLENLKLEWTQDVERFLDDRMLLEKLVPPSTLKQLEICGCNIVSLPAWIVVPNLRKLIFRAMANLEEWDTSYSNGEEHVIEELEIHDCPLLRMRPLPPKAITWVISNSDNVLSSWEECTGSRTNATSRFSLVTTKLIVKNCKVPLHQWRLLQHLPGMTSLYIKDSVNLAGSPELEDGDLEELPQWLEKNKWQLTKLQLCGCNSMESLPHWLGEVTSLKELVLWDCAVFGSLPESIHKLPGIQTLYIRNCPELKQLTGLLSSSLENLLIWACHGIKSLPEGMEQLTNLQRLDIYSCPELKQWYDLEENQMKLAHIKHKDIRSW